MRNGLNLVICCLILLGFNNCNVDGRLWKSGSGTVVEQPRQLGEFTKIEISGAIEVSLSQGDTQSVVVITDDNLQENVKTEVEGNTLKAYTDGHLSNYSKLRIDIVMKDIKGIELSGASKLFSKAPLVAGSFKFDLSGASNCDIEIKAIDIKGELSGASNLNIKGAVGTLKMDVSGASKCSAFNLISADADISASGASKISVTCDHELKLSASGASNISYKGEAKILKTESSGASSISKD